MYSLSATALLKRNSRDAKTNVTGPDPTLSRIGFSEFSRERSSLKYLRLNSGHFPGSWLNHRRSSVEGAASLGQKSIFASCFDRPRGHSRSTRMRQPSDRVGVSYARFSEICTMSQGRILALIESEFHTHASARSARCLREEYWHWRSFIRTLQRDARSQGRILALISFIRTLQRDLSGKNGTDRVGVSYARLSGKNTGTDRVSYARFSEICMPRAAEVRPFSLPLASGRRSWQNRRSHSRIHRRRTNATETSTESRPTGCRSASVSSTARSDD